jgi:DNA-binding IclR family transcriptional regulator
LRTIRDVFENQPGQASSAIALYVALTEIGSDHQSDTFTTSQTTIAQRAGLSVRTVRTILPVFVKLGLLSIQHNQVDGLQRQSTYSLNRKNNVLGNNCRTSGKRRRNHLPTLEESPEESHERAFGTFNALRGKHRKVLEVP